MTSDSYDKRGEYINVHIFYVSRFIFIADIFSYAYVRNKRYANGLGKKNPKNLKSELSSTVCQSLLPNV